jgi:hypothetical protein
MTDEQRHVRRLRRLTQPDAGFERVRERLFDQRRHARRDALQRLLDMQLVRCREHDAVRPIAREQLGERRVQRNAERPSVLGNRGRRIDDRRQCAIGRARDHLDVPLADHAGAGDCDANRFRHSSSHDSVGRIFCRCNARKMRH